MMELDFVCGTDVDAKDAAKQGLTAKYHDCTYHFCSAECKQQFERNPSAYADFTFGQNKGEGEDLYTY